MSVGDNVIDAAISNDTSSSRAPNDVVTDSTDDQFQRCQCAKKYLIRIEQSSKLGT